MSYDMEAAERAEAAQAAATNELVRRNRRIIAERLRWPAGTLEICEQLDRLHPGWHVDWEDANPGPSRWSHPARYSAMRHDVKIEGGDPMRPNDGIRRYPAVYGETVDELRAAITAMDERLAAEKELDRRMSAWMSDRPR